MIGRRRNSEEKGQRGARSFIECNPHPFVPISHIMSTELLHIASDESIPGRLSTTTPPVVFGCVARLSAHRPATGSRHLWNARRNTTHGFNQNAEILAEHTGRLPADIVLVPMAYLLDVLTDRDRLLQRIARSCRTTHPGRTS
jgi:hypothetical protein